MEFFANYLILLGWAIVVSIVMAVSYGISIWVFDKMLVEIKSLRNLTRKPIATAIVLGSFMLAVALVIVAIIK
jgi:hypothetical protein